jgi:hypothetical protein
VIFASGPSLAHCKSAEIQKGFEKRKRLEWHGVYRMAYNFPARVF